MFSRKTALNWSALIGLVLIWGLSFAVMKLALETIGPYWMAGSRIMLAALLVGILCIIMKVRPPLGWQEWAIVTLLGITGSSLPFILIGWASLYVPSGTAGLMMATSPILVMLLSIVALPEEKATPLRIAGLMLGFTGVIMVITGRTGVAASSTPTSASLWPYIALLGGAACYALNTIFGRKFLSIPVMTRSFGALVTGGITALAYAAVFEPFPTEISVKSLTAIAYLAIFPTALATMGVFWLLSRTSAAFVAQSNYLVPVSAIMFGAILFAEQLGWMQYTGIAIILAGIAIAERIWRRRV